MTVQRSKALARAQAAAKRLGLHGYGVTRDNRPTVGGRILRPDGSLGASAYATPSATPQPTPKTAPQRAKKETAVSKAQLATAKASGFRLAVRAQLRAEGLEGTDEQLAARLEQLAGSAPRPPAPPPAPAPNAAADLDRRMGLTTATARPHMDGTRQILPVMTRAQALALLEERKGVRS